MAPSRSSAARTGKCDAGRPTSACSSSTCVCVCKRSPRRLSLVPSVRYPSSYRPPQVLLRRPRRPIVVGKIHLEFYVKSKLELTPLTAIPGLPAPLAVSSPEATALDLIAFSHRLGGIERAFDVIEGLKETMTVTGMRSAVGAGVPVTILQRIGYILERLRFDSLAD